MRRGLFVVLAALGVAAVVAPASASAQVAPWASWKKLTTGNGFTAAVYDTETRRISSFRENLYRFPAPGQETRELCFDLYFGLRAAGVSRWMTEVHLDDAGYELGTGLIRTVQTQDGLRVTTSYVSPFGIDARALLAVAEVENQGPEVTDAALFSLHNFHVGGGADRTVDERIVWDAANGLYRENSTAMDGARGTLLVKPIAAATKHTATPGNPWPLVNASRTFDDVADSGVARDAVSGFQWDLEGRGRFPNGARFTAAVLVAWAPAGTEGDVIARMNAYAGGRTPAQLLDAERAGWESWRRSGLLPAAIGPAEERVSLQALAILRMGQVREPGAPAGQIVASLPPGKWDITWLRDGVMAARALTATGHYAEAEAALDFFLRGPTGDYQRYVGRPYALTVTRYYGNGREESDSNENGPNVELDGFGAFLEAAAENVEKGGRASWLAANQARIDDGVAAVLLAFRDAPTGLIAPESSIWETHWENGGRQRWAYTSGMAVRGLRRWASLLGPGARPELRQGAQEILQGMRMHLVRDGALVASVEQRDTARHTDGAAAFVLGADVIPASDPIGVATLDLLRRDLFLSRTTARGYKRNDDGGTYDEREWVVVDLAIARALREAGRAQDAEALVAWVTAQADLNFGLVPELLDQNDAAFVGEIPMVGFGAAAYLLALIDRSGTRPADPPQGTDAGAPDAPSLDAGATPDAGGPAAPDATSAEDATAPANDAAASPDAATADATTRRDASTSGTPTPTPSSGCSCATAASARGSTTALLLTAALLLTRRRARPPAGRPSITG